MCRHWHTLFCFWRVVDISSWDWSSVASGKDAYDVVYHRSWVETCRHKWTYNLKYFACPLTSTLKSYSRTCSFKKVKKPFDREHEWDWEGTRIRNVNRQGNNESQKQQNILKLLLHFIMITKKPSPLYRAEVSVCSHAHALLWHGVRVSMLWLFHISDNVQQESWTQTIEIEKEIFNSRGNS